MSAVKKAIITDAGFASRYLPITKTIPKAMIPIGAKPVMQLCVEECVEAGIEEIIIVTGIILLILNGIVLYNLFKKKENIGNNSYHLNLVLSLSNKLLFCLVQQKILC